MNSSIEISVVIPLYKCDNYIVELSKRLKKILLPISKSIEIIFVNDGSPHNDWEKVCVLAKQDQCIKGINLSRNFGQHYAINAGLANSIGEWVVVMDGDLQDQPEEIAKLFNKSQEGYDIVLGMRSERKDNWLKKSSSKVFYQIFSYLTDTEQDARIANFGIYHRKVINAILEMNDSVKYFPTMVQWVGFRKTKIAIVHAKREEGKSAYTLSTLLKLAFNNMIAFSDKPLRLTVTFGFGLTAISLLLGILTLVRYLSGQIIVSGYASLILSIWFLSGLIIAILGIVGIYVGKVFERVKDRPVYIISEKLNVE